MFEYRRVATIILNRQLSVWFKTGKLSSKSKDFYGDIKTFLSERYKDVIKRQVDGMLSSWISNRKNDFKSIVFKSSLDSKTKNDLIYINKLNNWFSKENHLARKIFKQVIKNNNFPSTKRINLQLNTKVYSLERNETTKSCSFHIKLKTCEGRGETITLSLKTNTRFEKIYKNEDKSLLNLHLCNSLQLNFDKNNELKDVVLCLQNDIKPIKHTIDNALGIDFGLKNLMTLSNGSILGINFIRKLTSYDNRIQKLQKELQRRKIKLKDNKRYVALQHDLKSYIKNEVNRVLNRIVKRYSPTELVVEKLMFSKVDLSKRLNRLLSRCGLKVMRDKLDSLSIEKGIKITYVNASYTSQECSSCHHVEKANRKNRDEFECKSCGLKINTDVNGSRSILGRSQDCWFTEHKYATRFEIKQHLIGKNIKMFAKNDSTSSCANIIRQEAV